VETRSGPVKPGPYEGKNATPSHLGGQKKLKQLDGFKERLKAEKN